MISGYFENSRNSDKMIIKFGVKSRILQLKLQVHLKISNQQVQVREAGSRYLQHMPFWTVEIRKRTTYGMR